MKTTLQIDDTVMAELKREAARQGRTMSELVETALRNLFRSQKETAELSPLPLFHSGGAVVDIADRDALYQATVGRAGRLKVRLRPPRLAGTGVLVPTRRHADVAEQVLEEPPWLAGNLLHEAHTAILMREHGIRRICTRDTDFHRFAFLEVVDPL